MDCRGLGFPYFLFHNRRYLWLHLSLSRCLLLSRFRNLLKVIIAETAYKSLYLWMYCFRLKLGCLLMFRFLPLALALQERLFLELLR